LQVCEGEKLSKCSWCGCFSPSISPDEKKKVLSEKYNIAMTAEMESEVQSMCNLSTAIVFPVPHI